MASLKALKYFIQGEITKSMQQVGNEIADDMRQRLITAGHVDTGALRDSIRSETEETEDEVVTCVYADAKSPEGVMYAEFIELGTGAAHGRVGGRVGTWKYKDRHGVWHETDGMDADPFIEPAVDAGLKNFQFVIKNVITDIARYGR